jgi:hypothetical protein
VFALGALEVWLFWKVGDYLGRRGERRTQMRKAVRATRRADAPSRRSRQGRRLPTAT